MMNPVSEESRRQALTVLIDIIKMIRRWLPVREDSIRFIRKIVEDLNDYEKKANIAKLTGASAGIAGGILLGVGAVASVATMGAAAPMFFGAGIAAVAGGGIVSGGAEAAVLVNEIIDKKKVEKVLRKDHSMQQEVVREVRALQDFITRISQEENISEEEALQNLTEAFLNRDHDGGQRANRRRLHDRITSALKSILVNPLTNAVIRVPGLVRIAGAAAELSTVAARSASRGTIVALTPILVAIDTYQLVATVRDYRQGSVSKDGLKLLGVANDLEAELDAQREFLRNFKSLRTTFLPVESYGN